MPIFLIYVIRVGLASLLLIGGAGMSIFCNLRLVCRLFCVAKSQSVAFCVVFLIRLGLTSQDNLCVK
jgi:hypothetical protein